MRFYLAYYVGKIIVSLMNLFKIRGGSNISGKIAMRICPDFNKHIKNIDYSRAVYITGTNGKSTTTNMIVAAMEAAGKKVATNKEGANLTTGLATTFLKNSDWKANFTADYLVFENDERYLPINYSTNPCKYLVITNIQKDQAQRNGTPEIIYNVIKNVVKKVDTVILNGDDPNTISLMDFAKNSIVYSVEKNSSSYTDERSDSYSMACHRCSSKIDFEYNNIEKIGKFKCHECGFENVEGQYRVRDVDFEKNKFSVNGNEYTMKYNQAFFLYGYGAAISILKEFKIEEKYIEEAFKNFKNISGRMDKFLCNPEKDNERYINFLGIKEENSETLQSAVNVIATDERKKTVILCLDQLMDFIPHYFNSFYPYEVDFSRLKGDNLEKIVCFGDVTCFETKNTMLYNDIEEEKIVVVNKEDNDSLFDLIDELDSENIYLIAPPKRFKNIKLEMKDRVKIK